MSIYLCICKCKKSSTKVEPDILNDIFKNKTGQMNNMSMDTDEAGQVNNLSLQIEDFKDDTEPDPDIDE